MEQISQNPESGWEHTLVFRGTPAEMADLAMAEPDPSVLFGGLMVLGYYTAQHDGKKAIGFKLADKMGRREVGRVVLLDTDEWFEELPEWTVIYEDEQEALENLAIFTARHERPKVSSITLDMAWEDEDGTEAAAAMVAAEHGVSVTILQEEGPGGGWPVVRVSGLTENVEKALRSDMYGWGMSNDDVKEFLG